MKRFFRDPAMLIQTVKVGVLLLCLIVGVMIFPLPSATKSSAKKPVKPDPLPAASVENLPPSAETPPSMAATGEEKKKKKSKKKKKDKDVAIETKNHLTSEEGRRLKHFQFDVPAGLRPAVDFWKMVYSKYGRAHEVFHDTEDLSIVYSVLDLSDLYNGAGIGDESRRALRRERVRAEKDRIRSILLTLDDLPLSPRPLSIEEQKIANFFKDDPNPEKYREAAGNDRLRSQTGIRENFIEGIKTSGTFLEEIEDVFTKYGLPVELTRLVFVESMFNLKARSKVGASGLWQFMPATGRLYLGIDSVADERNDPLEASHAAAKLLSSNYEALGTWPLAINAYNSGRATMNRAVNSMGTTDITTIIKFYRGGVYGFASRNFYPSFLAALEVSNQYPKYLGEISRRSKLNCEYYYLKNPQYFGELASTAGLNFSDLLFLNAHLSEAVLNDQKKIPAGYRIRIPSGASEMCTKAEFNLTTGTEILSDGTQRLAR